MTKKLKTWSGMMFINGNQVHAIIGTYTKKKAIEELKKFNLSAHYFNSYWSETGNKNEIKITSNNPEKVFYTKNQFTSSEPEYLEAKS